jgi:multicomponent Na+:H+ antiporter subunit G
MQWSIHDVLACLLAAVGVFFSLTGAVGIARMPDLYNRVQCSSKVITMGALPLLVALVLAENPVSNYGGRALIVAFLICLFGPLSGHALARAAYKREVPMWEGSVVDQAAPGRD